MRTKYFNDSFVGNNYIKASFTKSGELIRLLYGGADYKQFIDLFHVGVKINESGLIYLHNDVNNTYSQNYVKDTNILKTEVYNGYYKVKVIQNDYVPIGEKFLVRSYTIKNENDIDVDIDLIAYSKVFRNLNNDTGGFYRNNALLQYNHDFSVCIFSNGKSSSRQINNVDNNLMSGVIGGKDYIGMSQSSAIGFKIGKIKPNEEKKFSLYIYINRNKKIDLIRDLDGEINRIRKLDENELLSKTKKYWRDYLKKHDIYEINKNDEINSKIKKIYNRTILLFPLLVNEDTGGISAGIEVDEDKTKCGRYSYCWTRDAVFITRAMDMIGMSDLTEKFYAKFCKMTQSNNGMWEQRFYTDGRLAPCWGYQIDETASVIYGAYEHYQVSKNIVFLEENMEMLEKAIAFLLDYVDDLLEKKYSFQKSYDLWEEFEGYSLYSLSSIYAAFVSMTKIYDYLSKGKKLDSGNADELKVKKNLLLEKSKKIKDYCTSEFYDKDKKTFVRNTVDRKVDISFVGTVVPFNMFDLKDKAVSNTIEKINLTLRTYTGGYVRYEDDGYMGGYNPWPIATLWMAWYYLDIKDYDNAKKIFDFVTETASNHGLLGEQVNNDSMKPSWVIGLTWSHAMYIIVLKKILEK